MTRRMVCGGLAGMIAKVRGKATYYLCRSDLCHAKIFHYMHYTCSTLTDILYSFIITSFSLDRHKPARPHPNAIPNR